MRNLHDQEFIRDRDLIIGNIYAHIKFEAKLIVIFDSIVDAAHGKIDNIVVASDYCVEDTIMCIIIHYLNCIIVKFVNIKKVSSHFGIPL